MLLFISIRLLSLPLLLFPLHVQIALRLGRHTQIRVLVVTLGLSGCICSLVLIHYVCILVELLLLLNQLLHAVLHLLRVHAAVLTPDCDPPVVELQSVLEEALLHIDAEDLVSHVVLDQVDLLHHLLRLLRLLGDVELQQEPLLLVEVVLQELKSASKGSSSLFENSLDVDD